MIRLTTHSGRIKGSRHNDRNFDLRKAPHIRPDREPQNTYKDFFVEKEDFLGVEGENFQKSELRAYKELFGVCIQERNARYKKQGHQEKCLTPGKMHSNKKTCPDEEIIQLGDKDCYYDEKALKSVVEDYIKWHQERFSLAKILNYALHVDEATPHVHIRKTYCAEVDGHFEPNQKMCLEQMGLERPEPGKAESKYNNAKITYTKLCREKVFEIAKQKGIYLEEIPLPPRPQHLQNLNALEFKCYKESQKLQAIQQETEKLEGYRDELNEAIDELEQGAIDTAHEVLDALEIGIEREIE